MVYTFGYCPQNLDEPGTWDKEPPEVKVLIDYSATVCRLDNCETTNYIQEEEGGCDFSETDWVDEWHTDHFTPLQFIEMLNKIAEAVIKKGELPDIDWQRIAKETKDWTIQDESGELT